MPSDHARVRFQLSTATARRAMNVMTLNCMDIIIINIIFIYRYICTNEISTYVKNKEFPTGSTRLLSKAVDTLSRELQYNKIRKR